MANSGASPSGDRRRTRETKGGISLSPKRVISGTYGRAVRILAARDHGSAELRRKLRQKGCPAEEVEEALERLHAAGYLDDEGLVGREVERLVSRGFGSRAIRQRLTARGFPVEALSAALQEAEEAERFDAACAAALQKRFPPPEGRWERKDWLKAARFLAGRGFPEPLVRRILAEYEP